MKNLLILIGVFLVTVATAQPKSYSVQNAHSHNDYEQQRPFWLAYENGFGSIEADVYLENGDLLVAHNKKDINPQRTLRNLYLNPLQQALKRNKGNVYSNKHNKLLLLIDCKTEGVPALNEIIQQLKDYPELTKNKGLRVVITGNQPNKDSLNTYPGFIWFDGDLSYNYSPNNLARIALFSANYRKYASWKGVGAMDDSSRSNLNAVIDKAHDSKLPIRFWGSPDNVNAWALFKSLGVDYINTDKIEELAHFLNKRRGNE